MRTDNILVMDLGNGNVGIGTTAPGYKLEVGAYDVRAAGSTVLSGVKINRPDNSGTQGIFFGEDTNTNSGNYWENMHVRVDGGGGNIIFDTAGTERVRIDCSGNVGIGTTGPSQKLHIVGNEYITGNLVVDSYVTAGTEVRARSGVTDDGSSANLLLFTNNNGGTYGNIIMNSAGGNVGIGTTSPTEMLHVAKNIDAGSPGINIENSFTNIAESIDEKTKIESLFGGWTASYIYTGKEEDFTEEAKRSSYMSFWTRGDGTLAEAVRINSSGNVGIGTTSPGAKLQVNGNITVLAAGGTENYIGFNSPANPGAFTAMIGSYHTVNWGGDLRFYTQITG